MDPENPYYKEPEIVVRFPRSSCHPWRLIPPHSFLSPSHLQLSSTSSLSLSLFIFSYSSKVEQMRFLLECVGCCMMSAASSGEDSTAEPSSPATPRTEETRSLVVAPSETRRRKRASSRNASADWRPSLFAIAEDNAVPVGPEKKENRSRPAGSRNVKRCGTSSARVNAHTRPHDFGHNPLPMVVPAFSAAPFMF